jgi:hypothetical protein
MRRRVKVDSFGYRDKYICSEMVADGLVMFGGGATIDALARRCGTEAIRGKNDFRLERMRTLSPHELRERLHICPDVRVASPAELSRYANDILRRRGMRG